ncbi:alanine--tRNA ligase-related protein [Deinococcus koreensis]|uniref:Serine-tRNA(Ala) deacylase n=1 Tax=Deinococcus koreensis TaxID=2054903 RepID=A0A2K3V1E6_9DEIO|nr:alanyl-tRNA editing protein [Deinococcus koreensis]PNY82607.1 serine-tRNA(Ala) deacylase [Deinococcus koreensis]
MTRALYHDPGPLLNFTARVTATDGSRVALDATAFYPEGGGQPTDVGTLSWDGAQVRVLGARKDKGSGQIWHELEGAVPAVGAQVSGEVDAATRWRHSQRHSGEHLLAQAFTRVSPVFGVEAVSMNGPECTIDLRGDPAESHVRAAETLLREVLGRSDLRLETPVVPESDLPDYPLRRPSKVGGQVRLVIFRAPDGAVFDASACGGTHVPQASLAAPVVVLRTERIKGGLTRVVFMAGEEAAGYLSGVYRQARALAQTFSVPVERLPERVDALRAERDTLITEQEGARQSLAQTLVRTTPPELVGPLRLQVIELADPALLQAVLAAVPGGGVIVALAPDGRCGVGSALAEVDAGAVLREALGRSGGKGGGRPDLAQGRTDRPDVFLAELRTALARS